MGTVAKASPSKISPPTYTGSLRTRSSQTPAGSEKSRKGNNAAKVRKPICVGVACKSTAAVRGKASMLICPPRLLSKVDVHKRLNGLSRNKSLGARVKAERNDLRARSKDRKVRKSFG